MQIPLTEYFDSNSEMSTKSIGKPIWLNGNQSKLILFHFKAIFKHSTKNWIFFLFFFISEPIPSLNLLCKWMSKKNHISNCIICCQIIAFLFFFKRKRLLKPFLHVITFLFLSLDFKLEFGLKICICFISYLLLYVFCISHWQR